MKIKIRYIAVFAVVSLGIALTPLLIKLAYIERGYHAIGGEYLLIPLCLIIAYTVLETAKEIDAYKENSNKGDNL